MSRFVVRFMKDVLGENGRETEICQRSLEIDAPNEAHAEELAKAKFCETEALCDWSLHADRIQVREICYLARFRAPPDCSDDRPRQDAHPIRDREGSPFRCCPTRAWLRHAWALFLLQGEACRRHAVAVEVSDHPVVAV